MEKRSRINVLAMIMLFLACVAIVFMSMPAGVSAQQTRSPDKRQQSQQQQDTGTPAVPYWHVWVDDNGVSHQDRCTLIRAIILPAGMP